MAKHYKTWQKNTLKHGDTWCNMAKKYWHGKAWLSMKTAGKKDKSCKHCKTWQNIAKIGKTWQKRQKR